MHVQSFSVGRITSPAATKIFTPSRACEFWNQDRVPEINVRVAGFDCRRSAHDQDTRLNSCGHEAAQESA
jgi:hypothetical protein